jgi:hypothetical protein
MSNSHSAIRRIHTVPYAEFIQCHTQSVASRSRHTRGPGWQSAWRLPNRHYSCRNLGKRYRRRHHTISSTPKASVENVAISSIESEGGRNFCRNFHSPLAPRLKQAFKSLQDVLAHHWGPGGFFHLAINECSVLGRNVHCSAIVMSFA